LLIKSQFQSNNSVATPSFSNPVAVYRIIMLFAGVCSRIPVPLNWIFKQIFLLFVLLLGTLIDSMVWSTPL